MSRNINNGIKINAPPVYDSPFAFAHLGTNAYTMCVSDFANASLNASSKFLAPLGTLDMP